MWRRNSLTSQSAAFDATIIQFDGALPELG